MTAEKAEMVLNIRRGASRQEIDTAYLLNRNHCMRRSQYDTCPKGRDQAHQALILAQNAYRTLTGESTPRQMPSKQSATPEPGENIPRASLSGKVTPTAATLSRVWMKTEWLGWFSMFRLSRNPEPIVASLISVAMFLIALLVLACVHR